jgi:hypothetical protein
VFEPRNRLSWPAHKVHLSIAILNRYHSSKRYWPLLPTALGSQCSIFLAPAQAEIVIIGKMECEFGLSQSKFFLPESFTVGAVKIADVPSWKIRNQT